MTTAADPRARRNARSRLGDKVLDLRKARSKTERERCATALIRQAEKMVRSYCRRFAGPDIGLDDLEAEAMGAVWRAALSWLPGRASFESWARLQMRGALQKAIRDSRIVRGVHHSRVRRGTEIL